LSQPLPACHRDGARDPEVAHDGLPGFEQDVLRLDIPVHHAAAVRVAQRGGHFAGDPQCVLERQLLLACQSLTQRLALDVRHDVVQEASGLARIVERQDVWMGQAGDGLDLAEEPVGPEGHSELRPEHLDGDRAAVLQVLGEEDDRHPALAQLPFDRVALGEGGPETDEEVYHVGSRWRPSALPKSTVSAGREPENRADAEHIQLRGRGVPRGAARR